MTSNYSPSFSSALRMTAVSLLLAVTALAFASTGGGKKKHHELENNFTPINTAATFSLKKSTLYSGSMVSFRTQSDNRVSLNAMLTYQHGNTTIILPYQYKVNIGPISNSFRNQVQPAVPGSSYTNAKVSLKLKPKTF